MWPGSKAVIRLTALYKLYAKPLNVECCSFRTWNWFPSLEPSNLCSCFPCTHHPLGFHPLKSIGTLAWWTRARISIEFNQLCDMVSWEDCWTICTILVLQGDCPYCVYYVPWLEYSQVFGSCLESSGSLIEGDEQWPSRSGRSKPHLVCFDGRWHGVVANQSPGCILVNLFSKSV